MWAESLRWCSWWSPPCLLRRVVVNFVHDSTEAFEGALWSYRGGWLTLRDVTALKASQQRTPILGDVVIHRSQIAFMQVLP